MLTIEEKQNKQKGMITSIIIHLLLLIFFLLYQAWPFDPPLPPNYGVNINLGISDVGSGDVQNTSDEGDNTEEVTDPSEAESEATEVTETETAEAESAQEAPTEPTSEAIESEVESLVETTEQTNTPTETSESETTEEVKEVEETVDQNNMMGGQKASNNNNGNDANEVGDKGQENGEINDSDIYKGSTPGGGGGSSYDLAGWKWDRAPRPQDKSNENGKIVFRIKVDEDGYVESVSILESTVSASTAAIYKKEVEKVTFTRTAGGNVPPYSMGTVTFIIKSR